MRGVVVSAVVATSVLVALGWVFTARSQSNGPGISYFRSVPGSVTETGTGPASVEVWQTAIWLLHADRQVGVANFACTRVTSSALECSSTVQLPLGTITMYGQIVRRPAFQLQIFGGTGYYGQAAGVADFSKDLATFYFSQ